jgi:hypothetical protein
VGTSPHVPPRKITAHGKDIMSTARRLIALLLTACAVALVLGACGTTVSSPDPTKTEKLEAQSYAWHHRTARITPTPPNPNEWVRGVVVKTTYYTSKLSTSWEADVVWPTGDRPDHIKSGPNNGPDEVNANVHRGDFIAYNHSHGGNLSLTDIVVITPGQQTKIFP